MNITARIEVPSLDDPVGYRQLASQAVKREYRKATGSRRESFVWRWNTDGWLGDGSGVNLHGSLCGIRAKHGGYPVLAECWVYVRVRP